jgi:hypothetical protein
MFRASVFKLFRPRPAAQSPSSQPPGAELRGTTTEGYHFALRLQCNRAGLPQHLVGWHGSSKGGARVEMQCGPDGVWRDLQGRHAPDIDALIPQTIRLSAGWAAQWEQLAHNRVPSAAGAEHTAPSVAAPDAP